MKISKRERKREKDGNLEEKAVNRCSAVNCKLRDKGQKDVSLSIKSTDCSYVLDAQFPATSRYLEMS